MPIHVLVHPLYSSLMLDSPEFWSTTESFRVTSVPEALRKVTTGNVKAELVAKRVATILLFYRRQIEGIAASGDLLLLAVTPPVSMTGTRSSIEDSLLADDLGFTAIDGIIDYFNEGYLEFLQFIRLQVTRLIETEEDPDKLGALLAAQAEVSLDDEVLVWGEAWDLCVADAAEALRNAGFRSVTVDMSRCPS